MNEEEAFNDTPDGAASVAAPLPSHIPGESEAMDVPLRPEEKRRLNWENGLYLAPLTTVGNLVCFPFKEIIPAPHPYNVSTDRDLAVQEAVRGLRRHNHLFRDGTIAKHPDWPERRMGPRQTPRIGKALRYTGSRWLSQRHGPYGRDDWT